MRHQSTSYNHGRHVSGRSQQFGYILEFFLVPFVLLFALGLPLLDLCTIALRVQCLYATSRDAASYAAKAKSFAVDTSSQELSAINVARTVALADAARFSGLTIDTVQTFVVMTDLNSKTVTRQATALATAADTNQYVYQIEVVVSGRVRPLLILNNKWFGNVPGLTEWLSTTVRSREYCEFPQGLSM